MSNNLFPIWVKENISIERKKRNEVEKAYTSLKNKDTSYAKGIESLLDVRNKVVALWEKSANTLTNGGTIPQQPLCGSEASPKLPSFEEFWNNEYMPFFRKDFCCMPVPVVRKAVEFTFNFFEKLGNFTKR